MMEGLAPGHVVCFVLFFGVLVFRYTWSIVQLRFHYPNIFTYKFWRELRDIILYGKEPVKPKSGLYAPPFSDLDADNMGWFFSKLSLVWTHFQKNQHQAIQARDPLVFLINYLFTLVSLLVYTYIPIKLLSWNALQILSTNDGLGKLSASQENGYSEITAAQVLDCYSHTYVFPFLMACMMFITLACIITGTVSVMFYKEPETKIVEESSTECESSDEEEEDTRMKKVYMQEFPHKSFELRRYDGDYYSVPSEEQEFSEEETEQIVENTELSSIQGNDTSSAEERIQKVSISVSDADMAPETTWYYIDGFSRCTLVILIVAVLIAVPSFTGSLVNRFDSCSRLIDQEVPPNYLFGELLDWGIWSLIAIINVSCLISTIVVFTLRMKRERERAEKSELRIRALHQDALSKPVQAPTSPQPTITRAKDWLRALYQLDPHNFRFDLLGLWLYSTAYLVYNSPFTLSLRTGLQASGGLFGALLMNNISHMVLSMVIQFVPISVQTIEAKELISLGAEDEEDDFEYSDATVMHEIALSKIVSLYHRSLKIPIFLVLFEEYAQSQNNLLPRVVYIWKYVDQLEQRVKKFKKTKQNYQVLKSQIQQFVRYIDDNVCLQGSNQAIKILLLEIKNIVDVNPLDLAIENQSGDTAQKEESDMDEMMRRIKLIVRHNLYNSQAFYEEFRERVCCVDFAKRTGLNTNIL